MNVQRKVSNSVRAASYNVIIQVTVRIFTFSINAILLRYISQDMLGVVNVRLALLYSTILFLTKEAFEKACFSYKSFHKWHCVINLMWCTFPLGLLVSALLLGVWLFVLETPDPSAVPHYSFGVCAFAVSACVELLAEPLVVSSLVFQFTKLKAVAVSLCQLVRCVVSLVLITALPHLGVIGFCVAQICASITYTSVFYIHFAVYFSRLSGQQDARSSQSGDLLIPLRCLRDCFPSPGNGDAIFDDQLIRLTWSFFRQSFIKQLLTEGERYIMTFFDLISFADQGIYDVISNLGSLISRFVFWPVEEQAYILFCQTLKRGHGAVGQTLGEVEACGTALGLLVKALTLIGLIVVTFGFSNSSLLLRVYGGRMLSGAVLLLRCYCGYILLLAINGVMEAFVFATMGKEEVDRYNGKMLAFSAIFLVSAYMLTTTAGSVGFILANSVTMVLRILHSVIFVLRYFKDVSVEPVKVAMPTLPVIGTLGLSFLITACSERMREGGVFGNLLTWAVTHIGINLLCLTGVLTTVLYTEHAVVNFVWSHLSGKQHSD